MGKAKDSHKRSRSPSSGPHDRPAATAAPRPPREHRKRSRRKRSRSTTTSSRGDSPSPIRSSDASERSGSSTTTTSSGGEGRSHRRSRKRGRSGRRRRRDPLCTHAKALEHVVSGDTRRLRKLLRRRKPRVDLAAVDSQGRTLLHHACACGRSDVVGLLLRRGAPAGLADAAGDTPAHLAARGGHLAALAELMRAPDAPPLDAPGSAGATLRELMGRALSGAAAQQEQAGRGAGPHREDEDRGGSEAEDDDEEARWRRRLREECSDDEGDMTAGGAGDQWASGGSGGGVEGGLAPGETDDEWANRLWREMQRRRSAAAAASCAAFTADLRAETARRAAEAAERSAKILREEKAKDADWRRRTLAALEAGPATPPLDLPSARASYDRRWALLDADPSAPPSAAAGSSATPPASSPAHPLPPLRYDDIPWPLEPPPPLALAAPAAGLPQGAVGRQRLEQPPPPSTPPAAPSVDSLRDFLLLGASGPADVKRRLRGELLRWHPDKFGARFGARLEAAGTAHRQAALARVQQLAQVLTQVLGPGGGRG